MLVEVIQVLVVLVVALLFILTGGSVQYIKEGENYRNFFKTARVGIGFQFGMSKGLGFFPMLNTIMLMLYTLAVVSAIVFIPMIQVHFSWLITIGFIVILSALFHRYIHYVNEAMFNYIKEEKRN
ncbi:hypothetical protein [Staphylococcus equorum]|uniref:Uncharacterized protein n=1 Tax=Staphylococcus equorum TaxID=246432 RepID=A0AAP7IGB9_9STAP|nr:hypothetical protein [Staphylococcus equorum]OEK58829.1 hypothetical protein ASS94_01360 [Staphylococcus equorum]